MPYPLYDKEAWSKEVWNFDSLIIEDEKSYKECELQSF